RSGAVTGHLPADSAMTSAGTRAVARADARCVVAVTGAQSFLGQNLVGMLEEDDSVRRIVSIDRGAPKTASRNTRVYEFNLTDRAAEERIAEVLAAEGVD